VLRKKNQELEKEVQTINQELRKLQRNQRASSKTPEKRPPNEVDVSNQKRSLLEKEVEFLKAELIHKDREIDILKRSKSNNDSSIGNSKLQDTVGKFTPSKINRSIDDGRDTDKSNQKTQKFRSSEKIISEGFSNNDIRMNSSSEHFSVKQTSEYQIDLERDQIINAIKEKDSEITKMQRELRKLEAEFNKKIEQLKREHNESLEKNMSTMVNYLQQKEEELEKLKNMKSAKKNTAGGLNNGDEYRERSITELENLLLLASKDLRKKERENDRLKIILEDNNIEF
jgi:hypothetical protein